MPKKFAELLAKISPQGRAQIEEEVKKALTEMEKPECDMADHINTKEDVYTYLEAAFEENDPELIVDVLGAIARSKGMAQITKELNLSSESLFHSFPDSNPLFCAVFKVIDSLGYQLSVKKVPT